jgi:hypothetical protein
MHHFIKEKKKSTCHVYMLYSRMTACWHQNDQTKEGSRMGQKRKELKKKKSGPSKLFLPLKTIKQLNQNKKKKKKKVGL